MLGYTALAGARKRISKILFSNDPIKRAMIIVLEEVIVDHAALQNATFVVVILLNIERVIVGLTNPVELKGMIIQSTSKKPEILKDLEL